MWPDIVVTRPDSSEILLAVGIASVPVAEAALKTYMVRQSCSAGMLVTPQETLFFRNRFTGYEPETIQKIGECQTSELLDIAPQEALSAGPHLERLVEQWLESMQVGSRRSWPPSAAEAIESSVLPAVIGGVIGATGPRWRRTGS